MSAESPRHLRSGGPLTVPSQPPSDRSIIDAVSGFINDVTLSSSSTVDPKDVIQWARFETADINEPTPEGDSDNEISPLLLILGYGSGVQVWLIPPIGEAQEVLSWRQGTVRVLRILPTPHHSDCFGSKRPLIALCDNASPGPTFCSLSFISIRGGEQVKSIKFKNPILDVLANKRSVVVSFSERFAVFDAGTLEDRLAVTTCYPCPCPLGGSLPINPLALGDRWLAYADKKLNQSKRSSGGCEGEGVTSYTATVLHAAKSLSKGLRGLGESVAHSLAGGRSTSQSPSPPNTDIQQPGVVTILDIEGNEEDDGQDSEEPFDPIVAHFVAHSEAIIALKFDASGMLLVTADRRGHDFHVFRINPHPCGPSLASVHHLYILHRGDTTAKVQDIAISGDSRWTAISTLRGTTHVFAISPYGGACGVRTHTPPRVVNRLSRFHRSAGLPMHAAGQRGSPAPVGEGITHGAWFPNPRLPPYPLPTSSAPLAQIRPTANLPTHTITRTSSGRQRLSSLSEDSNSAPLLARARFAPPACGAPAPAGAPGRPAPAPHAALYLVAASGELLHLALHPRPVSSLPKEKICDESPIELEVEPVAQWALARPPAAADLVAPLPPSNPLLRPVSCRRCADICMSEEERWLSQVEIVTHAGPHRRLWMGPQFVFKTYNCTGSNSSLSEAETVEVDTSAARGVARSNPVNMPGVRPLVPVLIDSGSASSLEQSPSEGGRRRAAGCDLQLREDLAEAMKEDQGTRAETRAEPRGESGRGGVELAVDPLGCVVRPPAPAPAPPPAPDPDVYTRANSDEATFRPVVRAPAAVPRPDMVVRPLPRTTTIPVQTVRPRPASPPSRHLPLATTVVIPAALSLDAGADAAADCELHSLPDPRPSDDIHPTRARVNESPTPISDSDRLSCKDSDRRSSNIRESPRREAAADVPVFTMEPAESLNTPAEVEGEKCETVGAAVDSKDCDKKCSKIKNSSRPEESKCVSITRDTDQVDVQEPRVLKKEKKEATKMAGTASSKDSDRKLSKIRESSRREDSRDIPIFKEVEPAEASALKNIKIAEKETDKVPVSVMFKDNNRKSSKIRESPRRDDIKIIPIPIEPKSQGEEKLKGIKKERKEADVTEVIITSKGRDKKSNVTRESPRREECKNVLILKETQSFKALEISKEAQKVKKEDIKKEVVVEEAQSIGVTLNSSWKREPSEPKSCKEYQVEIKTEDQAWDMLLSEPDKPLLCVSPQLVAVDETKPKSKKNRKIKKSQDDPQSKSEEDSFVEIHAIEEKQQADSGELVSISTPFQELESSSSYSVKTKKSRSSKSSSSDRRDLCETKTDVWSKEDYEHSSFKSNSLKLNNTDIEIWPKGSSNKSKEVKRETVTTDAIKVENFDATAYESTAIIQKETVKDKKSKSLSPYLESRKSVDKLYDTDVTDVYVIDSTKEEFPEIQITRGNKMRKKSPQPEKRSQEKEIVAEKPQIKSWSSIAAAKSVKVVEEKVEKKFEAIEKKPEKIEKKEEAQHVNKASIPSTTVSLQEKLFELCKRTDIMVAECDAPSESELNFVEEHLSLQNLPPLEPLDFGLDDFKFEVMRDSLLETNEANITSPICKINIDNILSSIKETTSSFNLIDLEKVPAKREKGFSVVENDKITTQEVKLDDEVAAKDKEGEVMEKSSDDDIASPVLSADSDKEDKKFTGASSNLTAPSSKQSKSKKSRRKKK